MQKLENNINSKIKHRLLAVILIIALALFVAVYARNFWNTFNSDKTQTQQLVAALTKKIEELNQQLHAAHAGNPSDSQSYTTAQVKDAFLLVRTAATSLNHDQDVMVAKQLLQLAADHLANLKGEKIDLAKAALASDLARLNEVNVVDIAAIQEKLTILDKLINVLPAISSSADPMITPAKTKAKNNTPAKQTWYGSVTNVFSELKSVVKIRKKTDRDLSVADVDLARAQFKLIIEQLRWAAFYNNNSVYQRSLQGALDLLPQIFDPKSESVQKFAATLQELQKVQLSTEIPDIQNSVNALQALLVG